MEHGSTESLFHVQDAQKQVEKTVVYSWLC